MSSDGEQAIQKSALLAAGQAGMIPGALASPQPTLSPYHNAMASLQGIPAGLQAVPGMPGVLGVPMHQPQAGHPAGMHPGLVPQGLFFCHHKLMIGFFSICNSCNNKTNNR